MICLRVYFYTLGDKYQICPWFCWHSTPDHNSQSFLDSVDVFNLPRDVFTSLWQHPIVLTISYLCYCESFLIRVRYMSSDPGANRRGRALHLSSLWARMLSLRWWAFYRLKDFSPRSSVTGFHIVSWFTEKSRAIILIDLLGFLFTWRTLFFRARVHADLERPALGISFLLPVSF